MDHDSSPTPKRLSSEDYVDKYEARKNKIRDAMRAHRLRQKRNKADPVAKAVQPTNETQHQSSIPDPPPVHIPRRMLPSTYNNTLVTEDDISKAAAGLMALVVPCTTQPNHEEQKIQHPTLRKEQQVAQQQQEQCLTQQQEKSGAPSPMKAKVKLLPEKKPISELVKRLKSRSSCYTIRLDLVLDSPLLEGDNTLFMCRDLMAEGNNMYRRKKLCCAA